MDSSTLHSRSAWRRLAVLAAVLLFAWGFGAVYTLHFNVEMQLTRFMLERKLSWIRNRLPAEGRVLVFGGSSSSFSISPTHAVEHGVPLGNLGMGAGIGAKALTRLALAEARRGDVLVMAFEPELLSGDGTVTLIGAQSAIVLGRPGLASASEDPDPNADAGWSPWFWALRPGGHHAVTMFGKVIQRRPLYRYAAADFFEDGQQQTEVRGELGGFRGEPLPRLSEWGRQWIRRTRGWCEANGAELVYALPWTYTDPAHADEVRRRHADFVAQVAEEVEVLQDSRMGVVTERDWYCDTQFHMTLEGSRIRTGALVEALQARRR